MQSKCLLIMDCGHLSYAHNYLSSWLHVEAVGHALQSSSVVAPEEAIKTVQMILTPSQGRPLPPVHLENVSLGLLLTHCSGAPRLILLKDTVPPQ